MCTNGAGGPAQCSWSEQSLEVFLVHWEPSERGGMGRARRMSSREREKRTIAALEKGGSVTAGTLLTMLMTLATKLRWLPDLRGR